jgi:hypothetical protein
MLTLLIIALLSGKSPKEIKEIIIKKNLLPVGTRLVLTFVFLFVISGLFA